MKSILLTAAITLSATSAFAGTGGLPTMSDPLPVIAAPTEAPGSGAIGWMIPLIAIAAIALAADN